MNTKILDYFDFEKANILLELIQIIVETIAEKLELVELNELIK
jgi:hypothetical protein